MRKEWRAESLSEVIKLVSGQHIEAKDYNIKSRGVGYLTGPSDFGAVNPVVTKWTEHPKVRARKGDILITVKGSGVGKINFLDQDDVAISRQLMAIRVTGANPRFVYAFLSSIFDHLQSESTGAAIPGISRDQILGLRVSIPPPVEQQRIVGILDNAFDGIASAKANAQKNLQNACAIFESHLENVFTEKNDGWLETSIGQCIRFIDYRGKTPTKTLDGLRLITAKNVKMGYLRDTPMEFVAPSSYDRWMTRGIPRRGDVLFTTEAPLGNIAQLDTDEKVVFAQRIIIMQPDASSLDSTFLKYLLLARPTQQLIKDRATGATAQGIKASLLKAVRISFPQSLRHQAQIASKLDALKNETNHLASIYQQKVATLEALKRSLLHEAFSGNL
jgi:type I restriction enzyme S subunit